ncbi:hypothetical protein P261_00336 [Lachnospiraceae bacterium TWA4]|nr:hypothetical protein P261_00336 [Lachnospiraceae bacterium TWA4]
MILGAFGCGAFYNPPEIVVQAFNSIVNEFEDCFETIEFAVYCKSTKLKNYQEFLKIKNVR